MACGPLGSEASHLTGLRQARAHPEAGRHARREGCGQRAAQARIDHPDASGHRLHDELAGEVFDAGRVLAHLPAGRTLRGFNLCLEQLASCDGRDVSWTRIAN